MFDGKYLLLLPVYLNVMFGLSNLSNLFNVIFQNYKNGPSGFSENCYFGSKNFRLTLSVQNFNFIAALVHFKIRCA